MALSSSVVHPKTLTNSTKLTPPRPLTHLGRTSLKRLKLRCRATESKRPSPVDPAARAARVRLLKMKSALGVWMKEAEDTDNGIISWAMVGRARDGACLKKCGRVSLIRAMAPSLCRIYCVWKKFYSVGWPVWMERVKLFLRGIAVTRTIGRGTRERRSIETVIRARRRVRRATRR